MDFLFWCVVGCFLWWRYREWRIRYYHEEKTNIIHMEMETINEQRRKG